MGSRATGMGEISGWHPLRTSSQIKAFALAATIKGWACAINARSMDILPPLRLCFFIQRSGGKRAKVSISRGAERISRISKRRVGLSELHRAYYSLTFLPSTRRIRSRYPHIIGISCKNDTLFSCPCHHKMSMCHLLFSSLIACHNGCNTLVQCQ